MGKVIQDVADINIRKKMIELFNSQGYHELKAYYDSENFFQILRVMRNENIHSNFLAWVLDPKQKHELGNYPMRKFLEMTVILLNECKYTKNRENLFPEYLIDYIIVGNYEIIDVHIEREKVITNNKRIDIFIEFILQIQEGNTINIKMILENKVYSKEHSEQTIQYYEWAKQKFKEECELIFLYLSPISNSELYELIEQQCLCKEYIQINYQALVNLVLEPCKMKPLSIETKLIMDNYLRCLSYPSIDDENSIINGGLVMAISESEKKLLFDFWESNKPLLLAMLNVLKDDEDIDQEERGNMDNLIKNICNKPERDHSKYLFNGQKYLKNRLVLAVVREYIGSNNIVFEELKKVFEDKIQGGFGVCQPVEYVANRAENRFFMKEEDRLKTTDGIEFVVCNQWGRGNIDRFISAARENGFIIEKI